MEAGIARTARLVHPFDGAGDGPPPRPSPAVAGEGGTSPLRLRGRVGWGASAYCSTISARRFCGSRTPSAVGTRSPFLPTPTVVISLAETPSVTSWVLTAAARRSERP